MKSPTTNATNKTIETQPKVAGAYYRVSTANQEEDETIKVQVADIHERLKKDGNILPEENIFIDDGWTGTILARPGLDKMRSAALDGKFQILYVYDRGRIARKYSYQEIVIEELEDKGIQFIPLHDKQVKTDEDRFFQGIQGLFAEWERVKIADRFRIAKIQRAKGGRMINGHALYGYKIIRTKSELNLRSTEKREYAISEQEAHIVRLIYQWFVHDKVSLRKIIERLFELGIKPPKNKNDHWVKESIIRILKCETYSKGYIHFNKSIAIIPQRHLKEEKYRRVKKSSRMIRDKDLWIEYKVPTIIADDGTFKQAQELLTYNKEHSSKNRKHPYLLTGKIYCGCGYKRIGDGRQIGHCYYRCTQRIYKHPKPSECTFPGVNVKALDASLWAQIKDRMQDPTLLQKHAELRIKSLTKESENKEQQEALDSLIKQLEEETERYARAYGKGEMEFEQYKKLTQEVKQKREGLQSQKAELEAKATIQLTTPERIHAMSVAAIKALKKISPSNQKTLVSHIVKKVVVYNKEVEVTVHIPVPSASLCELTKNLELYATNRNRRLTKRRKINPL